MELLIVSIQYVVFFIVVMLVLSYVSSESVYKRILYRGIALCLISYVGYFTQQWTVIVHGDVYEYVSNSYSFYFKLLMFCLGLIISLFVSEVIFHFFPPKNRIS